MMGMMSDRWKSGSNAETTNFTAPSLGSDPRHRYFRSFSGSVPWKSIVCPRPQNHQLTIDEGIVASSKVPANGNVKVDSLPQTPQILGWIRWFQRAHLLWLESSYENSGSMISSISFHTPSGELIWIWYGQLMVLQGNCLQIWDHIYANLLEGKRHLSLIFHFSSAQNCLLSIMLVCWQGFSCW